MNSWEKKVYVVRIWAIQLRLSEHPDTNVEASEIWSKDLTKDYEDGEDILKHYSLSYVPDIISTLLIRYRYDNSLASHFDINKTSRQIARKNYLPILYKDLGTYVWWCDVCLASNTVRHKPYSNPQSLPVLTYYWKVFLIDMRISFLLLSD